VARNYLADAYLQQKQYKPAAEQYQVLLTQTPQSLIALNNLAWIYQQMQDKRAVATAEQAHKLAPENPLVLDTLGWILVQQGDAKRGTGLLQKAHSLQPDEGSIHYHYAAALAKMGERSRAQNELESLLKRGAQFQEESEARALLKQLSGSVKGRN